MGAAVGVGARKVGALESARGAASGRRPRLGARWAGALLALSALGAPGGAARADDGALELTILHTNDLHGQVLAPGRGPGGFVDLGRAIRQERDRARSAGGAALLLDAGDVFKGTAEGDLTDGQVVVAWMNHLGYDAAAIGNHEFDHGVEVARRLCEAARFPVLGGNVVEEATGARPAWLGREPDGRAGAWAPPAAQRGAAVVRTVGGALPGGGPPARVAIVGLTTRHMKQVTLAGVTDGLRFEDEAEVLAGVLAALPPVDLVVALTHCGVETDRALARRFAGRVHVIVGGHSHTKLPQGERVGDVLLAQTGSRAGALGRVRVRLARDGGRGLRVARAEADLVTPGDDLEAMLKPWVDDVAKKVDVPVGHLAVDLARTEGLRSSGIGNLHCDLMRAATGVDVAFHNKSGIRADLERGAVTYRALYQVAPFGNSVVTLELGGADLRALLEGSLEAERKHLEVSGLALRADLSRPAGQRLLEVTVAGAPLDPARTYRVATNNFLAGGGDGHEAFTRGRSPRDTGVLLLDLLRKHFEAHQSPWAPGPLDERLRTTGG